MLGQNNHIAHIFHEFLFSALFSLSSKYFKWVFFFLFFFCWLWILFGILVVLVSNRNIQRPTRAERWSRHTKTNIVFQLTKMQMNSGHKKKFFFMFSIHEASHKKTDSIIRECVGGDVWQMKLKNENHEITRWW